MTGKRALAILAIGIAGYAVFALLFPRFSSGTEWNLRLGRDESIALARQVAARHGFNVAGWRSEAGVRVYRPLNEAEIHVVFFDPSDSDRAVGIRLNKNGQPNAVVLRREPRNGDDVSVDAARPIAERAFRAFVPDAATYRSTEQEDRGDEGVRFRWERAAPRGIVHRATGVVAGTTVRDIRYGAEIAKPVDADVEPLDDASTLAFFILTVFGLVLYVIAAGRGLVPHRLAVTLGASLWLLLMVDLFFELGQDARHVFYGGQESPRWAIMAGSAVFTIACGLALAGAYPSARRRFQRQLLSLEELLLRGRITSRAVGASVLTGLAIGAWVAAVPHLVRATGLFGRYLVDDAAVDPLLTSGAMPMGLMGPLFSMMLAFALVTPFVEDKLRGRAGVVLAFAIVMLVLVDDASGRIAPAILAAFLITLLYRLAFARADLLTLVVANTSAAWAIAIASRLVQPAAAIRADGWAGVIVLAIIAVAALAIALRGSTKPYLAWQPRAARAERERMQAEFDIARAAQERMLPATPPELPNTSIASYCRPARQVGGDLYDFVTMSDGTAGITVADVSGKGVPAALFMTITKGLLLAASDGRSDPLETLADVNAGIHSLGHRSVFVTMLFGVFDPTRRTFRFVRAGHAPLLVRRASGEVETFSPRGVGIGMTSPRMFSALCERSTIDTRAGDFLFLFSDGITEAMNERSEEFGEERLLAVVRERITGAMSAEEARVVIVDAVDQFRGNAAAHDDMTLVVMRT
jgi:Stage II sporulation protein E (SpoIIE)